VLEASAADESCATPAINITCTILFNVVIFGFLVFDLDDT
jgi:hypothetical protein